MRASKPLILLILCFAVAGVAYAQEVVHFTNGTTLVVRSHKIEQGMIHLTLETDAVIAFPAVMVEKVTVDGQAVAGAGGHANVGVSGGRGSGRPTRGAGMVPSSAYSRARSGSDEDAERELKLRSALGIPTDGGMHIPLTRPVGPGAMGKLRETVMPSEQSPNAVGGRSAPVTRTFAGKKMMVESEVPKGMRTGSAKTVQWQIRPEALTTGKPYLGGQGSGVAPAPTPSSSADASGNSGD